MASGRLFIPGWMPARDSNGDPIPNVVVSFYQNATDILASVYADDALTIPLTNPVAANSSGRFPQIYASDAMTYSASVDAPYGPAGQPFTFDGLQASQAADIAAANLAQGAAEDAEAALAATEAAIDAATQVGGGAAALAGALAGATAGTAAANVVVAEKVGVTVQTFSDIQRGIAKANIGISYVSPFDKGAAGDGVVNDTAALLAALADGRPVDLEGGTFVSDQPLSSTSLLRMVSSRSISGKIVFTAAAAGGLSLSYTDHNSPVLMENVSILTRAQNVGDLLSITYTGADAWNNRNVARCRLEGIEARGEDVLANGPLRGLVLTDVHAADILQPSIAGYRDLSLGAGNPASFLGMDDGITIVGTSITTIPSDINIDTPRIYNAKRAVRVLGHVEGVLLKTPVLVGVAIGVRGELQSVRPWLQIQGGHANVFSYGAWIENCPQVLIDGFLPYKNELATTDTVGVFLDGCDFAQINDVRAINQTASETSGGRWDAIKLNNCLCAQVDRVIQERGSTTVITTGATSGKIGPSISNNGTLAGATPRVFQNASTGDLEITRGGKEVGRGSNAAGVVATASGENGASVSLGQVTKGQRFRLTAQSTFVKGPTAGDILMSGYKVGGTATFEWLGSSALGNLVQRENLAASQTASMGLTGTLTVLTEGDLSIAVLLQSLGSNADVSANNFSMVLEAV